MESYNDRYTRYVCKNNNGIYDEIKRRVSRNEWINFLKDPRINWLPKPKINYKCGLTSWFTKNGNDKYKKLSLPVILKYLDSNDIKIIHSSNPGKIVYSDKYQLVCMKELKE